VKTPMNPMPTTISPTAINRPSAVTGDTSPLQRFADEERRREHDDEQVEPRATISKASSASGAVTAGYIAAAAEMKMCRPSRRRH
jgi:hypothetical protein